MTRDEIMALRPGREMDRLVAIHGLGWRWVSQTVGDRSWATFLPPIMMMGLKPEHLATHASMTEPSGVELHDGNYLSEPSTDHAAAMEALEEFMTKLPSLTTATIYFAANPHGVVIWSHAEADSANIPGLPGLAFAISRAILLAAKGGE